MTETFECGDTGALIAYLYEECEPDLRETISTHLIRCVSCAHEFDSLGWTRGRLQAWTPPHAALGFQMEAPAQEARLPWWRAPLPAWAQAAAALVIFGVGVSVGLGRKTADVPENAAASRPVVAATTIAAVSRTDLSQLEQRLRAEMAQVRSAPAAPARQVVTVSDEQFMKKVEALVAQSEERQRREFTLRSVEMARELEAQRRIDLASVRETVGQFQGVAGTEIRQQREAIDRINNFIRVSQQAR